MDSKSTASHTLRPHDRAEARARLHWLLNRLL